MTGAIHGRVVDLNNAPVASAKVSVGSASADSGADGSFAITVAEGTPLVKVSATGYLPAWHRVPVSADAPFPLLITLAPQSPAQPLDADQGGTVNGPRGTQFVAPAAAFADAATGAAITGSITVALTPLDPSVANELAAYPGALVAKTKAGADTAIGSYGVVDIDARQAGRRLTLRSGKQATLIIPAAANAAPAKATKLWSFDETAALWVEEGSLTLDATSRTYSATLTHLSLWNADEQIPVLGCIRGHVVDSAGKPLSGVTLFATNENPGQGLDPDVVGLPIVAASDVTDVEGRFALLGEVASTLDIVVRTSDLTAVKTLKLGNGSTAVNDSGFTLFSVPKDDPACLAVPDIHLGIASDAGADAGDASTPMCGAGGNPFKGTCAEGLWPVLTCFDPAGACTMVITSSSLTDTWANGSKFSEQIVNGTMAVTGTLAGPNGQVCGLLAGNGSSSLSIIDPSGKQWTFLGGPDGGAGDTILCPDGTQLMGATSDQRAAFAACVPFDQCTFATPPGSCTTDADCTALDPSLSCCQTKGGGICTKDAASCASAQQNACATDADCTAAICCQEGPVKVCVPGLSTCP